MIDQHVAHNDAVHDDKGSVSASSADALHADAFKDPYAFLQELDKDRNLISPTGVMSKEQLLDYSQHGADPLAREAATLGYKYFDDLIKFSNILGPDHPNSGLSEGDLKTDMDLYSGKLFSEKAYAVGQCAGFGLVFGAGSVAVGASAVLAAPETGLASLIFMLPVSAALGAGALALSYGTFRAPAIINDESKSERRFFASLPEFHIDGQSSR